MSEIGLRFKKVRTSHKLTQEQFAKIVKVNDSYPSQLETGVRNPGKRLIKDVCENFLVNETWLVTGEGPMNIDPPTTQPEPVPKADPVGHLEDDIKALTEIYKYEDPQIIGAIHANLKTFVRTVRREEEAAALKKRVAELESTVQEMAEQIGILREQLTGSAPEDEKKDRAPSASSKHGGDQKKAV